MRIGAVFSFLITFSLQSRLSSPFLFQNVDRGNPFLLPRRSNFRYPFLLPVFLVCVCVNVRPLFVPSKVMVLKVECLGRRSERVNGVLRASSTEEERRS